ncbi:P-II family nitrogen regulator [Caballeronia mineralivorans]|uniref:P-II family nitrogen regulator n=1 Tax=Caballeronia mineralivorans TaxID=2010198 RepID=UPI000A4E2D79|nr:P-II family nitrogen regulator [Caballeronia mineralivorans]
MHFDADDWATEHLKIEIFRRSVDVDALIEEIMKVAHVGAPGDGVVAILPVASHAMMKVLP